MEQYVKRPGEVYDQPTRVRKSCSNFKIRIRNSSYYGEEMIDMLKFIKKHVYKLLYEYHYHISNYYYKKGYWNNKVIKHANKEFELVEKLVHLEGV